MKVSFQSKSNGQTSNCCFDDLKTVDRIVHPTFEAAVRARGMMDDDNEIFAAFDEVVQTTVVDSSVRRCALVQVRRLKL